MHTLKEAAQRITDLAELNRTGILEQLEDIRDNLDFYTKEDRIAFRIFMDAGREMFAGVDNTAA